MPKKDTSTVSGTAQAQQDAASEGIDAYELPKSLVTRLARSALPENAKMQKEMVLALTKGSTVFVNYLAATAHDIALQKQHKSVSATDVLKALEQLDMGDMVPKLEKDLQAYRANQKTTGKRGSTKDKAQDASTASKGKQKVDAAGSTPDGNGKGKEKATITIPSRSSTSGVANQGKILTILEPEPEPDEDGEEEVEDVEDEEMVDVEEQDDADDADDVEEEDVDEGDDDDEVEEEGEELVDDAALENEELRRDARGVEERSHDMEEED